ncbi:MAG: putative C-S lyase [Sideroxydans sp.]|nr:putative C-S lyase [Sideroxydans sp.]
MSYDFDALIPREGTGSLKYDARDTYFCAPDVLPLWVADMDFAAPEAVVRALSERAAHPVYGYTLYPDSMYDALIGWLAKRHGWCVEREWIVMVPGVVPSLHAAVLACTREDEGVIVQPPVYFPFFSAVTHTGRKLLLNPLREDHGHYRIDFDHFEQCAAGAKLLLLCSPHNPVGRVWARDELERVLDIARRHKLAILADEIHADLVYPDRPHTMLATLAQEGDNIITAVAPSKTFNIPGLGLSALVIPDAGQRAAFRKVFEMLPPASANPFSVVAFEAAYREGEAWLDALLGYLRDTRDFAAVFLAEQAPQLRLVAPEGTYLLWLDCRALGMGDAELRDFFVQQAKLGLSPGALFGEGGSGFMRLNIGAPRSVVAEALQRIAAALRERDAQRR